MVIGIDDRCSGSSNNSLPCKQDRLNCQDVFGQKSAYNSINQANFCPL